MITINENNNIKIAIPTYKGYISDIKDNKCAFITNHNVPGFENQDIYFSLKIIGDMYLEIGDKVSFSFNRSLERVWAYNISKL